MRRRLGEGLRGQTQAPRVKERVQAAQLGVSVLRERSAELSWVQVGRLGDGGRASQRLGYSPQCRQRFASSAAAAVATSSRNSSAIASFWLRSFLIIASSIAATPPVAPAAARPVDIGVLFSLVAAVLAISETSNPNGALPAFKRRDHAAGRR